MGSDTSKIAEELRLREPEVHWLHDRYQMMCKKIEGGRTNYVDLTEDQFCRKFPSAQQSLAAMLFEAMDFQKKGVVDFRHFCLAVNILGKGTQDEKIDFAFRLYDTGAKGYIVLSDLVKVVETFHVSTGRLLKALGAQDDAYVDSIEEKDSAPPTTEEEEYINPRHAAKALLERMDTTKSGQVSPTDFKEFCLRYPQVVDQVQQTFTALRRAAMFDWSVPSDSNSECLVM